MRMFPAVILLLRLAQDGMASTTRDLPEDFVSDFASDPFATEMTFGFRVGDETFHMNVQPTTGGITTELLPGLPERPALYWEMDKKTRHRLHAA